MKSMRIHSRVAAFASAIALLLLISPVLAGGQHDNNRPVDITFTKWITTFPAMAGFAGGDVSGVFVGHVFHRNVSPDGHVVRLEAMYEVQDGDRTFAALIRGGSNPAGLGLLDGFILDGWRTGAPVHVEFQQTNPANGGCVGAPDPLSPCVSKEPFTLGAYRRETIEIEGARRCVSAHALLQLLESRIRRRPC